MRMKAANIRAAIVREKCVYQLCIVMHDDANEAKGAPVTL